MKVWRELVRVLITEVSAETSCGPEGRKELYAADTATGVGLPPQQLIGVERLGLQQRRVWDATNERLLIGTLKATGRD
jgi:hypothetical protein